MAVSPSLRAQSRWAIPLVLSLAAAAAPACKKKEQAQPTPKEQPAAPETPVPAPEGLAVEGIVRSPDAILKSFQAISPLVPERAAPILADVLHVSRETTEEVDGTKPAYFVLVRRGAEPAFALALPVKDSAKVLAALAKQGFSRTEDATQSLSIFEPGAAATGPKSQVLGVRRGYLLAASSVPALKELAPFATRTMPTRPAPEQDVFLTIPQAAVRTTVREALKAAIEEGALQRKLLVQKAKDGGPAGKGVGGLDALGDFLARQNERVVGWLADAGDAHVSISTKGGTVSLKADVDVPDAGSAFAKQVSSWPLGDGVASLEVPAGAVLAFAGRSSDAARAESSADVAAMLSAMFPADVGEAEKTKIAGFLASWDKARSELTSGALLYDGPARLGIGARLGAKDAPALAKLLEEGVQSILALKGVSEGLKAQGIGAPKVTKDKVAGVDVRVVALSLPKTPGEKPKPGEPDTADLVWGPSGTDVVFVAGVGAKELFAQMVEAKTTKSLKAPELQKQVELLGTTLAGVAVGLPARTVPLAKGAPVGTPAPPIDPVFLAIGKGAKGPFVSIDVSRGAMDIVKGLVIQSMLGPTKAPF